MNTKEKIELLQKKGYDAFLDAAKHNEVKPPALLGYDLQNDRMFVRRDIRTEVRIKARTEGVSMRAIANAINVDYQNFNGFLNNRRGLPFEKVEELLALLDL